jgi:sulfate transport system ATP-binding protein
MIAGLERPDRGEILIGGEELAGTSVQQRRVGFVFQHYALFRHMTVRDNVGFGLRVQRVARRERTRRVNELLELVQLTAWGERYPDQLSGGQRQRVALARALAARPRVLLLDEPFGALDARVRQQLRRWLDELHRELGVTSLLVTHDQEEALELANEVVVMHEGRVEQVGSPAVVYNEPATPFVAGFVGAANVLEGVATSAGASIADLVVPGSLGMPDGSRLRAYVRPHDVGIGSAPDGEGATVERFTNVGWQTKLRLRLDDGQPLVAVIRNDELPLVSVGDRVCLDIRTARVFEAEDRPGHLAEVSLDEPAGVP